MVWCRFWDRVSALPPWLARNSQRSARFFLQVLSLMLLSGAPVWLTVAHVLEDNLDLLLLIESRSSGL